MKTIYMLKKSLSDCFFFATTAATSDIEVRTGTVLRFCLRQLTKNFPASCCSSNGSVGITEEGIKSLDLERAQVETLTCNCREDKTRREL
ncbi:unnamed protein product [Trifolium pratense]|uniref:Uncharacterized protein n=1 Tax=Trifolium pratense TaxID=57577 RepID=A0ACB0I7J8_TRIPR|nr:unnamed protein product [Trifolium pratense]